MHRVHSLYAAPDDDASLIARYSHLIDAIARRLARRVGLQGNEGDLWSAGAMGLIDAAHRFDANREAKFETFVEHRIRGAMLDELRRMDHLPRRLRARTEKVTKARQKIAQELGREGTSEEVAKALGIELDELADIEQLRQPHLPISDDAQWASKDPSAEQQLVRHQLVGRLTDAIKALPERTQSILAMHYREEFTYREIGKILDISEARVCQLHTQAIAQLKAHVIDPDDLDVPADLIVKTLTLAK